MPLAERLAALAALAELDQTDRDSMLSVLDALITRKQTRPSPRQRQRQLTQIPPGASEINSSMRTSSGISQPTSSNCSILPASSGRNGP